MDQVILDTNILLIPGTLGVDVFSEIEKVCDFKPEFAVLEATLQELEKIIQEQRGKFKSAAKLGMELIKKKHVTIINDNSAKTRSVDGVLVNYSKNGVLVATQDAVLKKRLKKPYLTLRAKKYFVVVR